MEWHTGVKFTLSFYYLEADVHLRADESDLPNTKDSHFTLHFVLPKGPLDTLQDFNCCWALCRCTAMRVWLNLLVWVKSSATTEHPVIILLQTPWYSALSLSLLRLNATVISRQRRTLLVPQWLFYRLKYKVVAKPIIAQAPYNLVLIFSYVWRWCIKMHFFLH